MIALSKTPLRISFVGGGTDLPSFYKNNEFGAVLSTTIDSSIYVTVKKHTPLFNERIRLNYSETELVNDIEHIKNPIIKECLRFLQIDDRIYISTVADAPGCSGLGSSSAFCVGLLNALYKYKGSNISVGRLAEEAAHIEIDVLKRPMGKQDHYAAAFGGLNYFVFHADGTVTVKQVNVSDRIINTLFDNLLSFWTKESRPSESVLAEQNKNNSKNKDLLLVMRQQAEELTSLLYSDDFSIERFSRVIHEGWLMKRKLASNVSNTIIDDYYEAARKDGALGGKISGAGGGGFLNLFAPAECHGKISASLEKIGLVPFRFGFDPNGTRTMKLD